MVLAAVLTSAAEAEFVPAVDGLSSADGDASADELAAVRVEPPADAEPADDGTDDELPADWLVGDAVVPVRSAGDAGVGAVSNEDTGAAASAVPMIPATPNTVTIASNAAAIRPADLL